MIRKTLFGILFVCTAILFLSAFVTSVSASTLYVPDDYTTIQAAVDAAGPGDVIVVRDGTYKENVDVNKPHLTIKSENGADKTTVEAVTSSYDDIVFEVTEDYVNIIGFTVKAGDYGIYLNIVHHCNIQNNNISAGYGIYLSESSNNNIIKNTVSDCVFGITLSNSFSNNINNNILLNNIRGIGLGGSKNIVSNNTVSYNGAEGIYLSNSKSNSISNNTVSHNGNGIDLDGESEKNNITNNVVLHNKKGIKYRSHFPNNICNNIVSSNSYGIYIFSMCTHVSNNIVSDNTYGIYLTGSLNRASWKNTITNNNVSNNTYGIYLNSACIENTITNNNVSNSDEGILLSDKDSSENNISGNNVSSNTYGIRLFGSESNNITRNTANWNTYYGIYLSEGSSENIITQNTASNNYNGIYITESSDNICYLNNFANKADNVYSYKSTNTWNSTEKKTYIYKGLTYENYMGNYWSDYTGSDTDNNGIGDTSYSIDPDKDNYPLPVPWENYFAPPKNHPPTAIRMEPEFKEVSINFGDTITFRVKAEDEDAEVHNNLHMVQWFVDDIWMETDPANGTSEEANFTYTFENERTFTVNATVYDEQMEEASVIWEVNVGEASETYRLEFEAYDFDIKSEVIMILKYGESVNLLEFLPSDDDSNANENWIDYSIDVTEDVTSGNNILGFVLQDNSDGGKVKNVRIFRNDELIYAFNPITPIKLYKLDYLFYEFDTTEIPINIDWAGIITIELYAPKEIEEGGNDNITIRVKVPRSGEPWFICRRGTAMICYSEDIDIDEPVLFLRQGNWDWDVWEKFEPKDTCDIVGVALKNLVVDVAEINIPGIGWGLSVIEEAEKCEMGYDDGGPPKLGEWKNINEYDTYACSYDIGYLGLKPVDSIKAIYPLKFNDAGEYKIYAFVDLIYRHSTPGHPDMRVGKELFWIVKVGDEEEQSEHTNEKS